MTLTWKSITPSSREAILGDFVGGDGVRFGLRHVPTCHRRGPWRLTIEVAIGENHHLGGCFDEADQPLRNYHVEACAILEAQSIADVLWKDRQEREDDDPNGPADPDTFDKKTCPECGNEVSRRVDPRQTPTYGQPGVWVNYRCKRPCRFARDYVEELSVEKHYDDEPPHIVCDADDPVGVERVINTDGWTVGEGWTDSDREQERPDGRWKLYVHRLETL